MFFYANYWLQRYGRAGEPGYQCDITAATHGPVKTTCGIELIATHSYSDIEDGLDTLVVVGGAMAEEASTDSFLVECARSMAPQGAAGGVDLHRRIHFGGCGRLASAACDDALDVFGGPRGCIPFD